MTSIAGRRSIRWRANRPARAGFTYPARSGEKAGGGLWPSRNGPRAWRISARRPMKAARVGTGTFLSPGRASGRGGRGGDLGRGFQVHHRSARGPVQEEGQGPLGQRGRFFIFPRAPRSQSPRGPRSAWPGRRPGPPRGPGPVRQKRLR